MSHIRRNPFQSRYYVDQILSDLKANERVIFESIMSGTFPESVQEILENISSTHLPPAKMEAISIEVLKNNG